MAGTVIVGRIAVKVIPDTEDFRKDLKRKLDAIERSVDPIKVPAVLDDDRILQQFKRSQDRLEREAKKDPIEIDVDLATEAAQAAARRMHDKLDDLIGDIKVDVDVEDARVDLDGLKDRTIEVEIDGSAVAFAERLHEAMRAAANEARQLDATAERVKQNLEALSDGQEDQNKAMRRGQDTLRLARDLQSIQGSVIKENAKLAREVSESVRNRLAMERSIVASQDEQAKKFRDILDGARQAADAQIKLERSVEAANRETEKQARNAELAADAAQRMQHEIDKIKFNEDFERQLERTDSLLEEVNEEIQELSHLEDIDLILKVQNMSATERKIADLKDQMEGLRVQLTPDLSEEERQRVIRKIADLADKLEDELDNLEAEVEPSVGEAFYRRVQMRLAWLSRTRVVTLVPVVSAKAASAAATALAALSGARLQGKVLDDLFDAFKDLDKNLPKIAALGLGLAGISGFALSASANLFSMSKQLAQIGPIALGFPGLFAGMAIGIVTLVVALSDFGNRVPEVADAWRGLKPVIQDNFWAEAEEPIRRLTEDLMPQLTSGLEKTATQLGGLFGQFGEDLVKELTGTRALDQMFQDLADSIEIMKDGTGDFASIIRILGEVGAKLLPRLSRYFVNISSTFEDFLSKAEEDGSLDFWIDRAILRMRQLGRVIGNFGGILTGLAKAADEAGGSTLEEWGDDLQAIEDKVKSPAFQQDLVKVLRAADQAMTNIADNSGPGVNRFFDELSDTLSTVLPLVGDTIGQMIGTITDSLSRAGFQSGVIDFFQGIHDAVDTLSPAMAPISDALGALLSLGGKMAKAFSPALATTLGILSEAVQTMAPYLESVVEKLSGPLNGLLEELAGPIDKIAKAAGPALEKVADGIGALVEKITPAVGRNAEKLATFISDALGSISADDMIKLGEGIGEVVGALLDLVGVLADSGDGTDIGWLFDLTSTGDSWKTVAAGIDLLRVAIEKLNEAGNENPSGIGSNDWFKEFFLGIETNANTEGLLRPWFDDFKARIKTNWEQMKVDFAGLPGEFAQIGRDIMYGLTQGLSDAMGDVTVAFQNFCTSVIDFVKGLFGVHSPSTVFMEIGRDLIRGLVQGILELITLPAEAFGQIAEAIRAKFVDAATWLVESGRQLVGGLLAGINEVFGNPGTRLGELITGMRERFNGSGGWLVAPGSSLVGGLVAGISSRIGSVLGTLDSLISSARSRFNGSGGWLVGPGSAMGNGFATGIGNTAGNVASAAHALVDAAVNSVSGRTGALINDGYQIGAGLAQGLRSAYGAVAAAANALVAAASRGTRAAAEIASPSKLFTRYGAFMGEGLAIGMLDSISDVEKAAKTMVSAVEDLDFKPQIELGVSAKLDKKVGGKLVEGVSATSAASDKPAEPTTVVNITNVNPVAEKPSLTVNKNQQLLEVLEIG